MELLGWILSFELRWGDAYISVGYLIYLGSTSLNFVLCCFCVAFASHHSIPMTHLSAVTSLHPSWPIGLLVHSAFRPSGHSLSCVCFAHQHGGLLASIWDECVPGEMDSNQLIQQVKKVIYKTLINNIIYICVF